MDVVYVLRKGPLNCVELMYSLRSLENIKHNKVFIVGYKPERIQNVIHIPAEDKEHRFKNVVNKYKIICNDKRISDDFILMHDDNYILEPIDKIDYYKRGTLKEHRDAIYKKFGYNMYYKAINAIYELFPQGDSFDVHTPIIYNKEKLKNILDRYGDGIGGKRSMYCNYYGVEGIQYENNDCKIYKENMDIKQGLFLSSDDDVALNSLFLNYMKQKFPNKSIYESFNPLIKKTMKFIAKPFYTVSLGSMIRFNHDGGFETNDPELIKKLSECKNVKKLGEDEEVSSDKDQGALDSEGGTGELDSGDKKYPTDKGTADSDNKKADDEGKTDEESKKVDPELKLLRQQLKEKTGQKTYHGRTVEEIKEKLANIG